MTKTIQVTDRQYEWFTARARSGGTIAQVLDSLIAGIERYEKDLAKYAAWVEDNTKKPPKGDQE